MTDSNRNGSRLDLIVRLIWIAVGVAGGVLHSIASATDRWPNADLITIAWFAFAALGWLLPRIDTIDFPGGGIKFRKAVQAGNEGITDLERALGEATEQTATWLSSVSWLNIYLQRADVEDDAASATVFRFCLERMDEAKEWMGAEQEAIRISLWWYDAKAKDLFFMLSNDIRDETTKTSTFAPNVGLMGQTFAENRIYNLADAPSSAFYIPIREAPVDYHGLLLVPVRIADEPMGVISIDRQQKSVFSEDAQKIAEALASLIAYAFMHPRTRTLMLATPARVNALLLSWRVEQTPPAPDSTPSPSSGD
jgi:hypothetical protein